MAWREYERIGLRARVFVLIMATANLALAAAFACRPKRAVAIHSKYKHYATWDRARPSSILFTTNEPQTGASITQTRKAFLDWKLKDIGVDADSLFRAAQQSISDPTAGYDGAFGKSAIRTYRSFLYPKKESSIIVDEHQIIGMALRTAQQIDFLLKRHRSHMEEWVRHHDGSIAEGNSTQTVFPIILVLDNLRSAFNVGSIFRTADATGCAAIVSAGITPHPFGSGGEKVAKSALGAERVVASQHFTTTKEAIESLRQQYPNYKMYGLETTSRSRCYTEDSLYPKEAGVVLVLGNEVTGLDTTIMPLLDDVLEIPMFGTKNSLNVASCAPIVLYEIVRQWTIHEKFQE